jgi:hypothetical protein
MYVPEFPYIGNQAIIKSDRVVLMGDKDSVFLFGNEAVSLSSKHTVNLDAKDKVIISSPKIELGNKAETLGEPIILGDVLVSQLVSLIEKLIKFCETARDTSYTDLNTIQDLAAAADVLYLDLPNIKNVIQNSVRSTKVFVQKND